MNYTKGGLASKYDAYISELLMLDFTFTVPWSDQSPAELARKSQNLPPDYLFSELQNILSWRGPRRIIKSNSMKGHLLNEEDKDLG